METFSALLAFCTGNWPVTGEFPAQRPVTRSFDVLFDLRPNKWLSKQSHGDLRRHCAHHDVIVMKLPLVYTLTFRFMTKSTTTKFTNADNGLYFNIKTIFPGREITVIKISRSLNRLIFIMGAPIPQKVFFEMEPMHHCIGLSVNVLIIWQLFPTNINVMYKRKCISLQN